MEKVEEGKSSFFITIIKSVLISLSISLVLILIFAFVLRFAPIPDNVISPVNQIIKCVSILFGVLIGMKKRREMGLITGLIVGLIFAITAFLLFSLLSGSIEFSKTIINDLFFGGIIGAISGIIVVSIKKNK